MSWQESVLSLSFKQITPKILKNKTKLQLVFQKTSKICLEATVVSWLMMPIFFGQLAFILNDLSDFGYLCAFFHVQYYAATLSEVFWDRQAIFPNFSLQNRVSKYSLERWASDTPTKWRNLFLGSHAPICKWAKSSQ